MKFTVELEDFWFEEDEDLSESLKAYIKRDVVHQIAKSIEGQVEKEITRKVSETISDKMSVVIDSTLSELVDNGFITKNNKEIPLVEHVKDIFNSHHSWNSPEAKLEKLAKRFGEEMRLQYNNAFASKIVSNMKEQGLLKDEVVQILLEGK